MSKYNEGDKFVIEIEEKYNSQTTPFSEELYKIKGFNSLVFDDNGLNKLQKINPKLKIEDIDDMLAEYDLKQESYKKGLNDAWELAEKIIRMDADHKFEIFGEGIVAAVIAENTPQEALAKVEAYEKSKEEIKVGDVVYCFADCDDEWKNNEEHYGVVTNIYPNTYHVLMKNGDCADFEKEELEKTGKHIDIQGILNEIGKENEHDGE